MRLPSGTGLLLDFLIRNVDDVAGAKHIWVEALTLDRRIFRMIIKRFVTAEPILFRETCKAFSLLDGVLGSHLQSVSKMRSLIR